MNVSDIAYICPRCGIAFNVHDIPSTDVIENVDGIDEHLCEACAYDAEEFRLYEAEANYGNDWRDDDD